MIDTAVKFTKETLRLGLSSKGNLSNKQFQSLGYSKPFKGWRKTLVGSFFRQEQIDEFISLKNAHRKNKDFNPSRAKKKTKSKVYTSPYYDDRWIAFRKKALARDGYKCVMCGRRHCDGIKLHVHHLLYQKDLAVWDVPLMYVVTLCDECHRLEHSKVLTPPSKKF